MVLEMSIGRHVNSTPNRFNLYLGRPRNKFLEENDEKRKFFEAPQKSRFGVNFLLKYGYFTVQNGPRAG